MKISLVTVTYNSAKTLRDTIDSVLFQSYSDIEYIIVDGFSTDDTVNIIHIYEPQFKDRMKWISEPDNGLYDAMNKGFSMATGDIVGIINSDDLLSEPTAIEEIVSCFKSEPTTDCVYADLYYVAQNDTSKIVRYWKSGKQRNFSKGWHPAHPTFYVKREVYSRCGMFDLSFKLAADFELMLRLIEKYKISIKYFPKPLVRMRLGGTTSKNFANIKKQNLECIRAFHKNEIPVGRFYLLYRLLPKLRQFFH